MRLHVYHICRIRSVAKDSFTLPRFSLIIFPVVNMKSPEPDLASKFPCHPRCESFVERFLGLALRAPPAFRMWYATPHTPETILTCSHEHYPSVALGSQPALTHCCSQFQ